MNPSGWFLRALCAVLLSVSGWGLAASASQLPILHLEMPRESMVKLDGQKNSNDRLDAKMSMGGLTNVPVKVRNRGRWSRWWNKTPMKIFLPTNTIPDRECLNLNSTYRDASWVRERLAYYVYERCGVPAPHTRFMEVRINSRFRGVYVEVEQVDSGFFRSRGLKGAEAFKSASEAGDERKYSNEAAYRMEYEKQTKKKSGYEHLMNFCEALDATKDIDTFFREHVDLDKYVNYLAANILSQNWDGLNKNHVTVLAPGISGKWFIVPWDVDRTFGDVPRTTRSGNFNVVNLPIETGIESSPGVTGWNRLQDKFWKSKDLRKRLAARITLLLEQEFTPEKLNPLIDQWTAEVRPRVEADRARWGTTSELDLDEGIQELKAFIVGRRAFVKSSIHRLVE